jgi:hypothetical protein
MTDKKISLWIAFLPFFSIHVLFFMILFKWFKSDKLAPSLFKIIKNLILSLLVCSVPYSIIEIILAFITVRTNGAIENFLIFSLMFSSYLYILVVSLIWREVEYKLFVKFTKDNKNTNDVN